MDKTSLQLVNEFCQKIFRGQTATVGSQTYQACGMNTTEVTLTLPDGEQFFAKAESKKAAKQEAADEALNYLYDTYRG